MKKLHIRFMKDLRNIQFGELFDIISNDLAAKKVEIPLVKTAIERLKPHRKELLRMNNKKLRHPLTQLIQKQVNSRTEYLACLRMTVDAKMLSHKPEERTAAERQPHRPAGASRVHHLVPDVHGVRQCGQHVA